MPDRHACPTGRHPEPHAWCYDNHVRDGRKGYGCRCAGCREQWRLYRQARAARRAAERTCPNCAGPAGLFAAGECEACYWYRRRAGRVRPPEAYDPPPRHCANCDTLMPTGKPLRHGRCEACARYHDRNGRERPARLYARAA